MTPTAVLRKAETKSGTAPVCIRLPEAKDAKAMHQLVAEVGVMDVNSEYAYMLLGEHFNATCALAEGDDGIVGFISAYRPPNQPDVLFIWQIAVRALWRKHGLGQAMIYNILKRKPCETIRYIHTTITPSNSASRTFFTSLAVHLNASFHEQSLFPSDYFSHQHEEESLFVIGPFAHLSQ